MDDSQRVAAKIALKVLADDDFLLAGGQALIEHGITERPSNDVDLSLKDPVASKLLAVYSRGYARDYLDAYSIITST